MEKLIPPQKRVVIMVTGCTIKPYSNNLKECERTWMPLLRKMGYRVISVVGNPDITHKKTQWHLDNYFSFVNENTIKFETFDNKVGIFDKSVYLPAKWVLEETDYEYYFKIDSDSFVHPQRFHKMLLDNLYTKVYIDYMGCCTPWMGGNPNDSFKKFTKTKGNYAAGCGYMLSKEAMNIVRDKIRVEEPIHFQVEDWLVGRTLLPNGISLLHDSRICFESKFKRLIFDENGIGTPYIGNKNSHLAIQHYMNGHMDILMKEYAKHYRK